MVRGGGFPDVAISGAATLAPNMIHFVYDATAGQARAYLNGVLNNTVSVAGTINVSGSGFTIGGYSSSTGLSGNMDEFRIYNRALTQTEITQTWDIPLGAAAAHDAGAFQITDPVSPISPGTYPVKVSIRNYGDSVLTSANIGWTVNGVAQTGVSWTGSLQKNDVDTGIVLGNFTFPLGVHEIKAWTSQPNGQFDSAAYNDTTVASIICAQVLNGIYTIGGVNPDYPTINAAITDLNAAGVSGPVTFNIAPGTYNEQMTITEVLGGSATNTVTFQSSTGNADDVIVSFTASSTNNWTVNLDGADYVSLQNLTFEANDGTYARVVVLQNGATYNTISGCKIISNPLARTTSNSAGIYDANGNDDYNVVTGNLIQNGYYGMYSYGASTTSLQAGWIVENNIVEDFYYYGIRLYYHTAPKVNGNEVRNHSSSNIVYALSCRYCDDGLEVQNNRVEASGSSTQYALDVSYCDASPGNEGLVANNMVSVTSTGTGTQYAGYWYNSNYQRYYHNSLHLIAGSTTARAAYIYNGANNESYNNIFSNHGGGYSVYVFGTPLFLSNYNNYYSTGTNLGYWGSNVADLLALQTASGQDVNSVSLDAQFSSPSLLFPGSTAMDNLGTPLAAVPMDIFGNVRSLTTPDMGCMEYTPPQNDAGIISIDSPTNPQGPGVHTISASLQNFGLSNLNTATLNFSVNGGPTVSNLWVGFLTPGGTDGPVTIGTYNFPLGTHQIKVWTSNPNLVPDENNLNDTMVMTLNVCIVMSGSYSIGDTSLGADYPSFTDAFTALNSCGINGTITFNVQPGTYNEQLTLTEVAGASNSNRIIFQSSTGNADDVILTNNATGTGDNWTVFFNGADFISLENITIKADNATYARVIVIQNGADFNVISGCKIISNPAARGTSNSAGIYEPSGSNDNYNVIVGNLIQNGYYGIYSYGSSTTSLQEGTIIENNVVEDFYYYGVYLYYHLAPKVNGNDIANHSSSGIVYALNCAYCQEDMEMQKNKVVSTGSSTQYAMRVYYCTGTAQAMGLVANNMISVNTPSSTSTNYGAYWYYSNFQRYYNNSIHLVGGGTAARASYFWYGADNIQINNIYSNYGGGYTVYFGGTPLVQSDYNNYHTSGTQLAYWGSAVSNLAALQLANGMDSNSVSMDPLYSIPDMLFPGSVPMDNLGTPLMDVTDDYFGNPRSLSTPDMGCVEYTPPQDDAGIVSIDAPGTPIGPGVFSIAATIKNFGLVNLSSCNISYSINGGPASTSLWGGNLAPDSTDGPITLGNFNFTYGSHQLKVWTSDPNNTTDGNHLNDTMEMSIVVCDIVSGTFTIGDTAQGADFPSFQLAVNSLTSCGIGDTVLFLVDSGSYNEQLVIPFIPGTDTNARVIFQSATGNRADVVLHYAPMSSTESYVVLLDDADYISFKDMTITVDAGASYGRTVYLQNGADHNEFINCEISTLVMTSSLYSPVYSPNTTDEYNLWEDCDIIGGYYGFYLYGTGGGEMSNIIRNCSITDWHYYGVYLYYQNTPIVKSNYVKNSSASGIAYAIRNYYCYGPFETSYNRVELDNSTTSYGIYVYQSSGGNTPGRVYNNSIVKTSGTASYLLYIGYSSNVQFYHNTVHSMGTATSGYGLYFTAGSSNIELVNNIITTAMGYPIYLGSATYLPFISVMDYNNIYTTGPTLAYATSAYATLADWQAYSGLDSNSVSSDPGYLTTTNLTPSVGTINNLALPVAWITDDINGNPRPATPDMGAYEFDPLAYEAEMIGVTAPAGGCDQGIDSVKVKILNRGALPITDSLWASYEIKDGSSIVTEMVNMVIQPNDTVEYTFSVPIDLSVAVDSIFKVRSWIMLTGDPVPENDTSGWKNIPSMISPAAPQVANVTINQGDSASLFVLNPDTNNLYYWFDVPIGGNYLAISDTFVTPPLFQTSVYYVEATGGLGSGSISTIMVGGNSQSGNMFDVNPLNPVTIDSFYINTGASGTVEVYWKLGTYLGSEQNASA
jgi:hypothetical protein